MDPDAQGGARRRPRSTSPRSSSRSRRFGLYDGVLNNPNFVLGAGSDKGVLWGALFEILTALTGIGTAVALYPVIKRYGPSGALGFVASRTLEAADDLRRRPQRPGRLHAPPGRRRHRDADTGARSPPATRWSR